MTDDDRIIFHTKDTAPRKFLRKKRRETAVFVGYLTSFLQASSIPTSYDGWENTNDFSRLCWPDGMRYAVSGLTAISYEY